MVKKSKLGGFAIFLALSLVFLSSISLVSAKSFTRASNPHYVYYESEDDHDGWFSNLFHDHDDHDEVRVPQILIYQSMLNQADGYDVAWNGNYKGGNLMVTMHKDPKPIVSDGGSYDSRSSVNMRSNSMSYSRSSSVRVSSRSSSSSSSTYSGYNSGTYESPLFGN